MREMLVICEQNFSSRPLGPAFQDTLPATYVIPRLQNNDAYTQYRYGLAIAAAVAELGKVDDRFEQTSVFGENLTMVAYAPEEQRIIELAAKLMGVQAVLISTPSSQEPTDTQKVSPVAKHR